MTNLRFVEVMPNTTRTSGIMDGDCVFCYCKESVAIIIIDAINSQKKTKLPAKSIEQRKDEFRFKINAEFGDIYPMEMLVEFIEYWTEHNDNGKLMRFEKEKTFGLSRRLATWHKNYKTKQIEVKGERLVGRQDETTVKKNIVGWNFNQNQP